LGEEKGSGGGVEEKGKGRWVCADGTCIERGRHWRLCELASAGSPHMRRGAA